MGIKTRRKDVDREGAGVNRDGCKACDRRPPVHHMAINVCPAGVAQRLQAVQRQEVRGLGSLGHTAASRRGHTEKRSEQIQLPAATV